MSDPASLERAALNILTRSFGLRKDQNLLMFVDANSLEIAEVVSHAARHLDVLTSVMFVSEYLQSELGVTESLPPPVESAIRDADAILSCLSARPEHLPYRLRVLRTSWSCRTKLAHAPGMNLDILQMADTDYGFINECGQLLALALILGNRLEVITTDQRNNEYRLVVEIGGWEYPPGISDGVVHEGTWANLPPGEVYIVPQNGEGKIAINGSLPGYVMRPGEDLILTFHDGRLVDWSPPDSPAGQHLFGTQIAYAEHHNDKNWSNLAEIGFGLNPAIDKLVGIEVVDEKKANTLHVALGLSTSLGGNINSVIHCDLVAERPTVRVNGRSILEAGRWCLLESDWRLDHQTVSIPEGWWENIAGLHRSGIRTQYEHERLVCKWNSGRGRIDSASVGGEPTARLAAKLYALVPENGDLITKGDLLDSATGAGLNLSDVPGLLRVMQQFDLIHLTGQDKR